MRSRAVDVAVVGGGLVGTALADELIRAGARVLLVDEHHPGRASDAGAGILSPETAPYPDDRWYAFAHRAARHYRPLVEQLRSEGELETGFAECGLLSVALRPEDDEWFAEASELGMRRAAGVVREMAPEEAQVRFPPLGPVRRVVHNPDAARVDGRLLTAALLRRALRAGLDHRVARCTQLRTRGDRVVGVVLGDITIDCGALAVAGGAWSKDFETELGAHVPVEPVKGQIVHLRLPGADSAGWPIVQPLVGHYLVAWPDGRVACGGTYEPDAGFDVNPTAAGLGELLRDCLRLAPGLARATFLEARVGLRPVTVDGMPVLGPVPGWENAFVDTGHGTEGLLLGPYSGAVVAGMVLGHDTDPLWTMFDLRRFVQAPS
jgi:D-amino-acid dehydrogenase